MDRREPERLRVDVLTLFPAAFGPALESSILGIAARKGIASYHLHNIRDYSLDKHHKVDDRPYGGGPGMVLQCEPVFRCYEAVRAMDERSARLIMLTPQGALLSQSMAREFAASQRLMLLCGHYEGFDERIRIGLPIEEVSIGDYVLSGGEIAAMVVIDVVVRLLPDVLGDEESARKDSFTDGRLEYPHYTRPPVYRGMAVPDVLLSGNHAQIDAWRNEQSLIRTKNRRVDLLHGLNEKPDNGQEKTNDR